MSDNSKYNIIYIIYLSIKLMQYLISEKSEKQSLSKYETLLLLP
ncbi:hypothetical protein [Mammaliicoccus lentus]|nr:hypothetical protein [Mammaliicoccus lentus]